MSLENLHVSHPKTSREIVRTPQAFQDQTTRRCFQGIIQPAPNTSQLALSLIQHVSLEVSQRILCVFVSCWLGFGLRPSNYSLHANWKASRPLRTSYSKSFTSTYSSNLAPARPTRNPFRACSIVEKPKPRLCDTTRKAYALPMRSTRINKIGR